MSELRACNATGFCLMTMRYTSTREDDGPVRERMKAIAHAAPPGLRRQWNAFSRACAKSFALSL